MKTLNEIRAERDQVAAERETLKAQADKLNALLVDGFDRAEKIYR